MTAAILLFSAAPAFAAQRYADPMGDNSDTSCPLADPCDLETAVEHASVQNGDEVIVAPGNYPSVAQLDVTDQIDLHGASGQPRPTINTTAAFAGVRLNVVSTLRHVQIESPSGGALFVGTTGAAVVERVIAHTSQGAAMGCWLMGGTIRDTVCWASGINGRGIGANSSIGAGNFSIVLRNVTAIASGPLPGWGIGLDFSGPSGANYAVDAKSVIADGPTADVRASGQTGASTTIALDHSNYGTEQEVGTAGVTDPGTGTNLTAVPTFVNAAAGDFHQAAGSPTIDTGDVDGSSGQTDIDGDARVIEGDDVCPTAADMGADEVTNPSPPDCIPPDTTITGDPGPVTGDVTPTFTFSSTEGGSTFECSIDQGTPAFSPCSSPGPGSAGSHTPASDLADGAYTFRVRAKDGEDNTDASPATHSFTVDTVPPARQITGGPSGPTGDSTPTFSFTSDEPGTTFECRVDEDSFGACSGPGDSHTTSALGDGPHIFEVQATDPAGNTGSAADRNFTVDTARPNTQITAGPVGTISDRTPSFSFTASEPGGFQCAIDGGGFAACSGPGASHTTGQLADGAHTLRARAVDGAGNVDSSPATRSFTVDADPPETTIDSGPKKKSKQRNAKIEFLADEPGSTFECSLDGEPLEPCTPPFAQKVKRKRHTFEVVATDQVGNTDPTPAEHRWKVKKKPS